MRLKNVILVLFLVASCQQTMAQMSQTSLHAGDATATNVTGTVIRSWDNGHIVSWYTVNNSPRLDITKLNSGTICRVPMPTFTVLDMAILDNYLYFCGRTSSNENSYGVLGRVDLNYTISNISTDIQYVIVSDVNTINKLTVYNDNSTPHLAAIGETFVTLESTYSSYSFIDCLFSGASPTTLTINTRVFSTLEKYDEIMATDNHIVCVGYYYHPMGQSFCYRRALKSNIADAMFDTVHYYNGGDETLSITRSTAMNNDMIAISYLSQNATGGNVTRTRLINTTNGINTKAFEHSVPTETDHNGIVFVPKANILIVMQNYYLMGNRNTNFMYIDPTATVTYVSTAEYKHREFFNPITVHDKLYYLTAMGAKWMYKDASTPPTGYPYTGCPNAVDKELRIIDVLTHGKRKQALSVSSESYYVLSMPTPVNTSTISVECINQ